MSWWRRYPRQAFDLAAFVVLGVVIVWRVIRSPRIIADAYNAAGRAVLDASRDDA